MAILDLYTLDLRISLPNHESLGESEFQLLMNSCSYSVLAHSEQEKLFGRIMTAPDCLAAEVDGCALVITHDGVVSIRGKSLRECVSAMIALINSVGELLEPSAPLRVYDFGIGLNARHAIRHLIDIRSRGDFLVKLAWAVGGAFISLLLSLAAYFLLGGLSS